jgi:hypothetical protein
LRCFFLLLFLLIVIPILIVKVIVHQIIIALPILADVAVGSFVPVLNAPAAKYRIVGLGIFLNVLAALLVSTLSIIIVLLALLGNINHTHLKLLVLIVLVVNFQFLVLHLARIALLGNFQISQHLFVLIVHPVNIIVLLILVVAPIVRLVHIL